METHDRLEQIRERLNKATDGPWHAGKGNWIFADYPVPEINGSDAVDYFGGHLIAESVSPANKEFIANSYQDIKYLLGLLQRKYPRCGNEDIAPDHKYCMICGLPLPKDEAEKVMTKEEIIDQLESLKKNSFDFAKSYEKDGETDSIWHADIEALDFAIYLVKNADRKCPKCGNWRIEPTDHFCRICGQKLNDGNDK